MRRLSRSKTPSSPIGEFGDVGVAVVVGEVDVRLRAVGVERQTEQTLFAAAVGEVVDVEDDRRRLAAEASDLTVLADDIQPVVAGAPGEVDGSPDVGDRRQRDGRWRGDGSRPGGGAARNRGDRQGRHGDRGDKPGTVNRCR